MKSIKERLMAKVVVDDGGCWVWQGQRRGKMGYGSMNVIIDGRKRKRKCHRLSYEAHIGPIDPATPCVLHRCDNPPCCNPQHLWLGTLIDNVRDRDAKGRTKSGPEHLSPLAQRRARGETW